MAKHTHSIHPNYYTDANGDHDLAWHEDRIFPKEWIIGNCVITALKYLKRLNSEDNPLENVKKARTYIDRLINVLSVNKLKKHHSHLSMTTGKHYLIKVPRYSLHIGDLITVSSRKHLSDYYIVTKVDKSKWSFAAEIYRTSPIKAIKHAIK